MNKPKGKHNGTIGGHEYFKCAEGHGLLTEPQKVRLDRFKKSLPTAEKFAGCLTGMGIAEAKLQRS